MINSFRILSIVFCFLMGLNFSLAEKIHPQEHNEGILLADPLVDEMQVVILEPSDSLIDGFPLLREKPMDDTVSETVYKLFRESYMKQSVVYYYLIQNYLVSIGDLEQYEPAYLLLSKNQGGFPQFGFYLLSGDEILDKTRVPYVELVKNNPKPENYLGSMTQIYPHEMGHVFYRMLSSDSDSTAPGSIDIHYSSLTTDYRTAFNEGIAMHFENMARMFDPDTDRREAILLDVEEKKTSSAKKIEGYQRDFTWPFRIGFYRASMITWYQNYEDIKRYEWVRDADFKYANSTEIFKDPEKSLYYRNSGINKSSSLKSLQRTLATEGVIASFFVRLADFVPSKISIDSIPLKYFMAGRNTNSEFSQQPDSRTLQYLKIFYILNQHVDFSNTENSQFLDFIEGYLVEFPDEKEAVAQFFKEATGYQYPVDPGPELWVINPNHEHGMLVMDPFGAITLPFYVFNLNAATIEDLLTFDEISQEQAHHIIDHISFNGPLNNYETLNEVASLKPEITQLLIQNHFYPEIFKDVEGDLSKLKLSGLIASGITHLLLMIGIYTAIVFLIGLFIKYILKVKSVLLKNWIALGLKSFLFGLLSLVIIVLTSDPFLWFVGFGLIILILTIMLNRNKQNFIFTISTTAMCVLLFAYTIF